MYFPFMDIHKKTSKASFQLTINQMKYMTSNDFRFEFSCSDGVRFIFMVGILYFKSELIKLTDANLTAKKTENNRLINAVSTEIILIHHGDK